MDLSLTRPLELVLSFACLSFQGLYLILEKLRIRVYRNLFRAVHIAGGKVRLIRLRANIQ